MSRPVPALRSPRAPSCPARGLRTASPASQKGARRRLWVEGGGEEGVHPPVGGVLVMEGAGAGGKASEMGLLPGVRRRDCYRSAAVTFHRR